jgi:hypothetical protein
MVLFDLTRELYTLINSSQGVVSVTEGHKIQYILTCFCQENCLEFGYGLMT